VPNKIQKARFQVEMGFPEFRVIHVLDAFPCAGVGAMFLPAGSEMPVIQAKHLRSQPGRNMHAIGNMSDGNFVLRLAGIEAGPHGSGYLAVQSGNCVGAPREFQAKDCHAEIFAGVAGILASQGQQPVRRNT
jgi:hypothetical protein